MPVVPSIVYNYLKGKFDSVFAPKTHSHTKSNITDIGTLDAMPIGSFVWWFGLSSKIPAGWLICNGQSCASYTTLCEILGRNTVPDLLNGYPFIKASSTALTQTAAGLPNLSCYLKADSGFNYDATSGLVTKVASDSGSGGSGSCGKFLFDASNCNSIYGNSDTVTPANVSAIPIIKAASQDQVTSVSADSLSSLRNELTQMITTQISNMDYVTSSGSTTDGWYRKYKSGWVEQGGVIPYKSQYYQYTTVTFPCPFSNTNYIFIGTGSDQDSDQLDRSSFFAVSGKRTTTSIKFSNSTGNGSVTNDVTASWFACGYSA